MARACKYITYPVIGQYSGPDFPVMPTGIMSDVNAQLVMREYWENVKVLLIHKVRMI